MKYCNSWLGYFLFLIVEAVYKKTLKIIGHEIHFKQKAAQHYCQNTFKKAIHRHNNVFYIQIFPLSKTKESQKKKIISSEGHILLHLMS